MAESFGGVIVSGGGLFLLREPTGHFGGLEWTFAKTAAKSGESPEDTALRAVREKTGYEARIRRRLSGAFNGKSGPATYFLMDASHPPGAANWQTKETYWARYDEAVHMIRRSSNTHARQRDLAILEAANVAVGSLVFSERMTVHPADWPELTPMPRMHVTLHPELAFDAQQMKQIGRGFVMHDMDAKWFIYLDSDRLKLHRSWTGILIFDAGLVFDDSGGARLSGLRINRDSAQYGGSNDAEDLELFMNVVRSHLLQPT